MQLSLFDLDSDVIDLAPRESNLAAKHGGRAKISTYCKFFKFRPPLLESMVCHGGYGFCRCPDLDQCQRNPPPSRSELMIGVRVSEDDLKRYREVGSPIEDW